MKIRILALTGIRSEYDLLYPLLRELQNDNQFNLGVIASGAHLSPLHDYSIQQIEKDGFQIVEKIENLLYSGSLMGKAKSSAILMQSLVQTLERENPDFLLVLGDREESIVGALTANYMNIPVIHLAGGDHTNPEGGNVDEQVRHASSKLSHIHFTMREEHTKRLIQLGEEAWRVHTVGSGGVDRIRLVPYIERESLSLKISKDILQDYAVVIHHSLNSDLYAGATEIVKIFDVLLEQNLKILVGYPNSDPGFEEVIKVINKYESENKITTYNNLNRDLFVNMLRNATVLVGNSSLGLHEAPYFSLPVINVGERQRGRLAGQNVQFVSADKKEIKSALLKALNQEYKQSLHKDTERYVYGDGYMAKKSIEIIRNLPSKEKLLAKKLTY